MAGVNASVAEVEKREGGIDFLVNNAGRGMTGAIEETGLDQIRALYEVNVMAPIAFIQAALPRMRARRSGHIINITSISGFKGWAGAGVYGSTKYALEGIGQTLALEVAPFGIKVTNVQPGSLRTAFQGKGLASAQGHVEDYKVTAHNARRILELSHGKQTGDPDRAAEMILRMVEAPKPPLNFLLGTDAVGMATQRVGEILYDLGRWAPLSEAIAYDGPQPFLRD
jgi:NAD(P)-dependent dehydrogenase (short-subunit alcohol dehydrogenase family)